MTAPFLRIVAGTALAAPAIAAPIERKPHSETHANKLARDRRRDAWLRAEALTQYWRARLTMHSAVQLAKTHELPEAQNHPHADEGGRMALVTHWRAAKASQLLTPAYLVAGVVWKKECLAADGLEYLPVERRQVERAIAEDEAFLASHPVRQTKRPEATARRRTFREAMRQRIREVAALRALADHEIRPALSLRHQHIGEFSEVHGVNLEWLLEGEGEMFKRGQGWP